MVWEERRAAVGETAAREHGRPADLARWEDWSSMDRLVQLFKDSEDDDSNWVRVPVINYLRASHSPEAQRLHAQDDRSEHGDE
jgi:hypothetical protein